MYNLCSNINQSFVCEINKSFFLLLPQILILRLLNLGKKCKFLFSFLFILFLFLDFIYLFLERGEGRVKEKMENINVWLPLACPQLGTLPTTQACALTGNQTSDPLVYRLVLSPLSHISQGPFSFDL